MRHDGKDTAAGLKLGSFQRRFAMYFMCRDQLERTEDRAFIDALHDELGVVGEALGRTEARDQRLWELQGRVWVALDPASEQIRLLSEVTEFEVGIGRSQTLEPGLSAMLGLLSDWGRARQLSRSELCQLQFVLLCARVPRTPER